MKRKSAIIFGVAVLAILGCVIYVNVNPMDAVWMPKCLSYTWLGIRCPGCGTQRALHSLLNGELRSAFFYNPLLVLSVPYLFAALIFEVKSVKSRHPKLHNALFGEKTIWVLVVLLVIYTIARNYFEF